MAWANVRGYVIRNYLDLDDGPAPGYGAYGPPLPPAYYAASCVRSAPAALSYGYYGRTGGPVSLVMPVTRSAS